MGDERHETVTDIVADIRAQNQGLPEDSYALSPLVCDLLSFADRIEAAARREREATSEKSSQVGNAAKMRDALENASDRLLLWNYTDKDTARMALGVVNKLNAAISAPPRNCDIGTPDEHLVRHRKWCWEHDCKPTDSCKLCVARWEQMPYEEGSEK